MVANLGDVWLPFVASLRADCYNVLGHTYSGKWSSRSSSSDGPPADRTETMINCSKKIRNNRGEVKST